MATSASEKELVDVSPEEPWLGSPVDPEYSTSTPGMGMENGTTFEIKVNNRYYNALFNTGAECSYISNDTFNKLNLNKLRRGRVPCIHGANGGSLAAAGLANTNVQMAGKSFTL